MNHDGHENMHDRRRFTCVYDHGHVHKSGYIYEQGRNVDGADKAFSLHKLILRASFVIK